MIGSLRRQHLAHLGWLWAAHQDPRTRRIHLVTGAAVTGCLLTLAGLLWAPLAAVVWAPLAISFVVVDWRVAILSTGVLAVLVVGLSAMGGEPKAIVAVLAAMTLAVAVAHTSHQVFVDDHHAKLAAGPGGHSVRRIYSTLFGVPAFVLFARFDGGRHADLRQEVVANSGRYLATLERPDWSNWAGTVKAQPAQLHFPGSAAELAQIVASARAQGRKVRVVGTAYSWAATAQTEDIMVCMQRLNEVALDLSNPRQPLAIVGPGATGRLLNLVCEPAGLALPTNVVMETVSFGGLIAAGAHGSGWETVTLSDYVVALELVDGTGAIRRFSLGEDGPEVMNALRVGLGLMGIITRITLEIGQNHRMKHVNRQEQLDTVLAQLEDEVPAHAYYDVYWWPGQKTAWVRTWDATDAPLDRALPQSPFSLWGHRKSSWSHWMSWFQAVASRPLFTAARYWPSAPSCRFQALCTPQWTRTTDVLEATHYRLAIEAMRVGCVEFAINIDNNFDAVRAAWAMLDSVTMQFADKGQFPLNVTVNARFIAGSEALLSPAGGNRRTCYIEALGDIRNPAWRPFAEALTRQWMQLPRARPHWGKEWDIVPEMGAHLRREFGAALDAFLEMRRALGLDPDDLFVNDLMGRTLWPEA